jgi:hypothetical protein
MRSFTDVYGQISIEKLNQHQKRGDYPMNVTYRLWYRHLFDCQSYNILIRL